jgi:hypothetical protein
MQERRVRLGDILDDYCPRERRVTNHAVVAMVEDQVKQTRCTTCDADHEYKHAKVPAQRRKKASASPAALASAAPEAPPGVVARADEAEPEPLLADAEESLEPPLEVDVDVADALESADVEERAATDEDDGPVHRRLIRATLPRQEGQTVERREPDFTVRQNDSRANGQRNDGNKRRRSRQQAWQGLQGLPSGPLNHGSSRSGQGQGFPRGAGPQGGNSQRHRDGNRQPDPNNQQGARQGQGGGGQRPGRRGRKRGGR